MKITIITNALAAATFAAGAAGVIAAPIAGADTAGVTTQDLGSQAELRDGNVVQQWTVTGLKPSSDTIPYQVRGTLWEATATDKAVAGSATPIVSNFNARAADGQNYRALFQVATPQGVNPATIAQGQETSGKIYFDVTGPAPDTVVYNAGGRDVLAWDEPPAAPQTAPGTSNYPSGSSAAPAEVADEAPATAEDELTPAPASNETDPAAPGAQGTPVAVGPDGVPLPEGSAGTPLPEGAPVPAGTQPVPAGSAGTPLPAGAPAPAGTPAAPGAPAPAAPGAPVPAAPAEPGAPAAPAPIPAGSQVAPPAGSEGTPLPGEGVVPPPVVVPGAVPASNQGAAS
ncbi:DUF1942 domain-containing protein [Mycobacterium sp. CPCC 205372]|uniref:DUF1942 domain-containing protein n=1 Tax=Mycobacterium hippophais TaxID=3016340 RepID=A0ABT4Q0Z7_9MYCO|nr:DUF1942 domain-containing protein [Mycobacterium hippophais]MCZ8382523.1 DUF1942 domain-containing protein [Mycobacterium hippophais]